MFISIDLMTAFKFFSFYSIFVRSFSLSDHRSRAYRPCKIDVVTSFKEHVLPLCWGRSYTVNLSKVKNGCLGCGRSVSLLSMKMTSGIVGLSVSWSCTQRSPTCMHLIAWDDEYESSNALSVMSNALRSLHRCQTWHNFSSSVTLKYNYIQIRK